MRSHLGLEISLFQRLSTDKPAEPLIPPMILIVIDIDLMSRMRHHI